MEDTKYNGWTNYETWNVKLWMDNDQGSSEYWDEAACEAYRNAEASSHSTKRQQATYDLAEMLKGEHTENNPLGDQASAYSDLLSAALSEVNWHEIAESLLDDAELEDDDSSDHDEE